MELFTELQNEAEIANSHGSRCPPGRNPAWKNRKNMMYADLFSRVKGGLSLSTCSDAQVCKSDSLLHLYRD